MASVFVGLSGGVDSAVSAALLKEQGHDVTGAFIKIWQPEFLECTWREDRLDAMRVAAALDIPFKELDLSEEYKNEVINEMLATYENGETPNPDVLCNKSIKFGAFARWARSRGAEFVATGHYAQIRDGRLYRGADAGKDQSYFLHRLSKKDLERALFPVGGMEKRRVRAQAQRFGLPVAQKHDSQGLCFVGDITMGEFLRRYIAVSEGDVLNTQGAVIGRHEGALLYTIGQRHGFVLQGEAHAPHYVTAIDVRANTITVSEKREDASCTRALLRDVHWIGEPLFLPAALAVQVRYREKTAAATLALDDAGRMTASFEDAQIASPGQSLVFYRGDECLGGGIMSRFVHNDE
jgi:tRNA-specific 2-thiouridylase